MVIHMLLTICITTFNRWQDCERAISSIHAQDCRDFELIIVDDCSDSAVPPYLLKEIQMRGAKYIRHTSNKGLPAARNAAIEIARGDLFAFCDDDDQWPPDFVSRILTSFRDAPSDVGMVLALDNRKKLACKDFFDVFPRLTTVIRAGFTPPVASQAYKTELVRRVGGYRTEVPSGVDHDLWISLSRIDPKVAVAWGKPAIVGGDPSRERMTTLEHRRRAGIETALSIWRNDLSDVFGIEFYEFFVKSYQWYLDYHFFVKTIQKGEFLAAAKRAVEKPWLVLEGIKRLSDRLRWASSGSLFPKYKDKH